MPLETKDQLWLNEQGLSVLNIDEFTSMVNYAYESGISEESARKAALELMFLENRTPDVTNSQNRG